MYWVGKLLLYWDFYTQVLLIELVPSKHTAEFTAELQTKYRECFECLSKLNNRIELHIDDNVNPVAQPVRRIPFSVRKQVEENEDNLRKWM